MCDPLAWSLPNNSAEVKGMVGFFKQSIKKIIRHHYLTGKGDIKIAAAESIAEKNEVIRRGGFRHRNGFLAELREAWAVYSMKRRWVN